MTRHNQLEVSIRLRKKDTYIDKIKGFPLITFILYIGETSMRIELPIPIQPLFGP